MLSKIFGLFTTSSLIAISLAQAAEVATVMGKPGSHLDFTEKLIQERIELGGATQGEEASTLVYSILARKGVQSAVSVEVLGDQQTGTKSDLIKGLDIASKKAPIVITTLGPIDDEICKNLLKSWETAFVITAGNGAEYLDPASQPNCLAKNILRVAAFDQYQNALTSYANWGDPLVRIAAPSERILSKGLQGETKRISGTTAGASLVTAQLAIFARSHSELKGSDLIEKFLETNTMKSPQLKGKVEGERVLLIDG